MFFFMCDFDVNYTQKYLGFNNSLLDVSGYFAATFRIINKCGVMKCHFTASTTSDLK